MTKISLRVRKAHKRYMQGHGRGKAPEGSHSRKHGGKGKLPNQLKHFQIIDCSKRSFTDTAKSSHTIEISARASFLTLQHIKLHLTFIESSSTNSQLLSTVNKMQLFLICKQLLQLPVIRYHCLVSKFHPPSPFARNYSILLDQSNHLFQLTFHRQFIAIR